MATSLENLAELRRAHGRYLDAIALRRRALEIVDNALGPGHPSAAMLRDYLAEFLRAQGKYDDAVPIYELGVQTKEKALGPDHPDVAKSLSNLAGLYEDQGRYADAVPIYKRAVEIWKKSLGLDPPQLATYMCNLAELYQAQGWYADAEPFYKNALEIWEKALGEEHPYLAVPLTKMAELYDAWGRYDRAELFYRRAVEIDKIALASDHSDEATSQDSLSDSYPTQSKSPLVSTDEPLDLQDLIREDTKSVLRAIQKLGTIDLDLVETTPVVFDGRLYRFESVRRGYQRNRLGQPYFRFVDVESGGTTIPFGENHVFGSAFVEADTAYVFGVPAWDTSWIAMFWSKDLKSWKSKYIMNLHGWEVFNTSVCKAVDRYVMAFEVGWPPEVVGKRFTIRFATSRDLMSWDVLPEPRFSRRPATRPVPRSGTLTSGSICSTWNRSPSGVSVHFW